MVGEEGGARIRAALIAACHPQSPLAPSVGAMLAVELAVPWFMSATSPLGFDSSVLAGSDAAAQSATDRLVVALFEQEGQSLVRLARLFVDDRNAAEDLVQEAFIRLARSAHRIKDDSKAAAYLRSIVLNLARDSNRRGLVSPGAEVAAMLCAAPAATGERCGAPGPSAPFVVGADGTGHTQLLVEPSRVGVEGVRCARGGECGISVASEDVFARAPVVPISFAPPPGAAYDPTRLVLGLGAAALLVAIAAWMILRTDWSPVGEAAAPEIDTADYADLDAIIAALPPEEDEVVPTR